MAFRWETKPTDVFPQAYENYTKTIMTTGRRVANDRAKEAAAWMKQNAPWEDQTGRARAGLAVDVLDLPGVIAELVFHHDPDLEYPIFLETKFGGRDAIIAPAVDYWGARLMKDMQGIVNLKLATFG